MPTNTQENWYIQLKDLKSDYISINIFQDKHSDWIKLSIVFNGAILKNGYCNDNFKSFYVGKLSTISILENFTAIKNNIVYSDAEVSGRIEKEQFIYRKNINLIISKKCLKQKAEDIINDLKKLIELVNEEMKLLLEDALAEGKLITSTYVNCTKNSGDTYWSKDIKNLKDNIENYKGSEFWGENNYNFNQEYITSSFQYPWMPTKISKEIDFFDF